MVSLGGPNRTLPSTVGLRLVKHQRTTYRERGAHPREAEEVSLPAAHRGTGQRARSPRALEELTPSQGRQLVPQAGYSSSTPSELEQCGNFNGRRGVSKPSRALWPQRVPPPAPGNLFTSKGKAGTPAQGMALRFQPWDLRFGLCADPGPCFWRRVWAPSTWAPGSGDGVLSGQCACGPSSRTQNHISELSLFEGETRDQLQCRHPHPRDPLRQF